YDYIVRSPGVSRYKPELQNAINQGVSISTANQFWFDAHDAHKDGLIIAVTGTKGKSTTSSLIAHMLNCLGKQVVKAGNIGKALFDCNADNKIDFWVIELSSYQLADLEFSPDIAVLLNLYPEHLDWHLGLQNYFKDKLNIFSSVKSHAFISNQAKALVDSLLPPGVKTFVPEPFQSKLQKAPLPWNLTTEHNRKNVVAALNVIAALDLDIDHAIASLETFKSLDHRLQILHQGNQIIVNDAISTIPQSVTAALESFPGRPIVLIFGGKDRGLDWRELAEVITHKTSLAIGCFATGEHITKLVQGRCAHVRYEADFELGIRYALEHAPSDAVVLYSPGAPSAPPYQNYEERGQAFTRIVLEHVKSHSC
ncbi:MAG: UDP-N-acetylmuramoyl-L-alanine--D-glutamate ligase, partial [Bdellovibrionales bacterium]|nr:UDP-N-acetylmuramoyl-L-alanine--D-glutamate ligase [Bdellovibrionales bacterium]